MRFAMFPCLFGLAGCVFDVRQPASENTRCATLCAERADQVEQDSWCPIAWSSSTGCQRACLEAEATGPEVGDAFAACATTNPLCYEFLDTCMLEELFPGAVGQSIRVVGRDLESFEGRTVWLVDADDPGAPQQAVTVAQGSFDHTWTSAPRPVDWTVRVHFAIDVDGDGTCDPSLDRVGTSFGELTDVTGPAWDLFLDLQASSGSCGGLGAR